MFLAANPKKGKTDEEKSEVKKKYTPGEEVIPKVEAKEKTIRERRVEDEDRRLMDEVRNLSLREVGVESSDGRIAVGGTDFIRGLEFAVALVQIGAGCTTYCTAHRADKSYTRNTGIRVYYYTENQGIFVY